MAWAHVANDKRAAVTVTATSFAVSWTANTTVGNRAFIIVGPWKNGAAPSVSSITDPRGNSWNRDIPARTFVDAAFNGVLEIWSARIATQILSSDSLTVNSSSFDGYAWITTEFSGLAASATPVDVSVSISSGGTATAAVASGNTAATNAANELVLRVYIDDGFTQTWSVAPTGTSIPTGAPGMGNASADSWASYGDSGASASTPNETGTLNGATNWAVATIVYKLGSAAIRVRPSTWTLLKPGQLLRGSAYAKLAIQQFAARSRPPLPSIVAAAPLTVTPGTVALLLAEFAPAISTPIKVTPPVRALVLAEFAPTVSTPKVVTPAKASLTLATFAPTVALPLKVTPAARALALAEFAPTVGLPLKVTPAKASLALAAFAPTVATPRLVTPAKATLTLATFAPAVQTPLKVTPGVRSLTLGTFAPTLTITAAVTVTPAAAHLVLTEFAPVVTGDVVIVVAPPVPNPVQTGGFGHVVSDTGRRLRFPLAPEPTEPILVSPAAARLTLTTYAPTIVKGSSVAFAFEELNLLASELTADELAVLIAA